jgi:hypothetical protein
VRTRSKIALAILIIFALTIIAYPLLFSPKDSLRVDSNEKKAGQIVVI